MEKLEQDISAPKESMGLFAKLRKWIKSRFGRDRDQVSNNETYIYTNNREEIPELRSKAQKEEAPKAPKQESIQPTTQKTPESKPTAKAEASKGTPAFKIKPKKIVRDLNRMSDEEFARRLTGEVHLEDEEIQKIVTPSAKDIAAKNEPPKDIRPTLKDYPAAPQDELDLHGKKAVEAEREMKLFIIKAKRLSMRLIRIITGKGLHSEEGQSVLKEVAERKATELKREGLVFSYKWEKNKGSMLVYLT
jgi:DNA-nicking Smr family endonuclease